MEGLEGRTGCNCESRRLGGLTALRLDPKGLGSVLKRAGDPACPHPRHLGLGLGPGPDPGPGFWSWICLFSF